jgi:hypothetical protein
MLELPNYGWFIQIFGCKLKKAKSAKCQKKVYVVKEVILSDRSFRK